MIAKLTADREALQLHPVQGKPSGLTLMAKRKMQGSPTVLLNSLLRQGIWGGLAGYGWALDEY